LSSIAITNLETQDFVGQDYAVTVNCTNSTAAAMDATLTVTGSGWTGTQSVAAGATVTLTFMVDHSANVMDTSVSATLKPTGGAVVAADLVDFVSFSDAAGLRYVAFAPPPPGFTSYSTIVEAGQYFFDYFTVTPGIAEFKMIVMSVSRRSYKILHLLTPASVVPNPRTHRVDVRVDVPAKIEAAAGQRLIARGVLTVAGKVEAIATKR
jgi:hypothetical protein